MRYFALTLALLAMASTSIAYQSSCRYDYFGDYVCDHGDNLSSRTKQDFFGNDNTTFSNGKRLSCRWDYFDNYVCR